MGIRKLILSTIAVAVFTVNIFAQNSISMDVPVNGPEIVHNLSSDVPLVLNIYGHTPGEDMQVTVRDLHTDGGPNMHFKVSLVGTNIFYYSLFEGDITFTITGDLVTEQLTLEVLDVNRTTAAPASQEWWAPAQGGIQLLQDVVTLPELKVETRDHHLGNPSIYVLMLNVENTGVWAVSNMKVRYYFTTENISTCPILFDYYTPKSVPTLLRVPGTKEWALELDYNGTTVVPGQSTQGTVENQIHIYYPGYAFIDKFNDYSNPIPSSMKYLPQATLYKVNNKVAVYDENGNLLHGSEKPGYAKEQYIAQ